MAEYTISEIQYGANIYKIASDGGVELTQAQYDALSSDEKNNGTTYYITDGDALNTSEGHVQLTQAQYDALTTAEKQDPKTMYFITDNTPSSSVADYVIESGTVAGSGAYTVSPWNWIYRKWNSGIAECWARVTIESTTYAASGGNRSFNFNYPSGLFIDPPDNLQVSGGISGVVGTDIGFTKNDSNARGQSYLINRNSGAVTATGEVYIQVTGQWKAI